MITLLFPNRTQQRKHLPGRPADRLCVAVVDRVWLQDLHRVSLRARFSDVVPEYSTWNFRARQQQAAVQETNGRGTQMVKYCNEES